MASGFLSAVMSAAESQTAFTTENWRLLRWFNIYRLVMALAACALALSGAVIAPFGTASPELFQAASLAYLGAAVGAMVLIQFRWLAFESLTTLLAFADVVVITLLMHASFGLDSGIGLLLLVAVAGASLMLSTRLTILFAALATIAVGLEVNWAFLTEGEWAASRWRTDGYTQMGVLGIGLFATAAFTHFLARRLRATEELAQQRGVDLANLAQLNEVIIQRMQSGVLACDQNGRVRMMNKMARTFLGAKDNPAKHTTLAELSPELASQFGHWQGRITGGGRRMFDSAAGYTLLTRFLPIGERREDTGVLVFLEDTSVLKQQAAQLKISALARLTASIAHEIRNPLGAIAHAAQLLDETAGRNEDEARLLRIIQDQSRRMNVIIENVTQLSRRDKINPVKVQLGQWISDFIRQFALDGKNPPEVFQTPGVTDLPVCVDPDQLQQVVGNLCTNALRHCPPFAGEALISFKTGYDKDQRPYLDVVDRGSGVPPEVADQIFEPFYTTTAKGTGLGLYIARELCEGNGGRLDYIPGTPGMGACFRVTFARTEECSEIAAGAL
jgi:two-component system sensor histidine kinase PilS (NtrC family)